MPQTFVLPRQRELDDDANPLAGALLYFFRTGTTTPQAVYSDAALTTQHAHPIVADSSGRWPKIYLNSAAETDYRARITTAAGVQVYQEDDIERFTISQAEIAAALYPITSAEQAAGLTVVNYSIPSHDKNGGFVHPYRYGNNTTPGTTDMTAALNAAADLCRSPGDGDQGNYVLQLPAETCLVSSTLDFSAIRVVGTKETTINIQASSAQFDVITSRGNSTFENFTVHGGWDGTPGLSGDTFSLRDSVKGFSYNNRFYNVNITFNKKRGIYWEVSGYGSMDHVDCTVSGLHGLEIWGPGLANMNTTVSIYGNSRFGDCHNGYGVKLTECISISLDGVIIENTNGIQLNGSNNRVLSFKNVYQENAVGLPLGTLFIDGVGSAGSGLSVTNCYGASKSVANITGWENVFFSGNSSLTLPAIPLLGRATLTDGAQQTTSTTGGVSVTAAQVTLAPGTYLMWGTVQTLAGTGSNLLQSGCELTGDVAGTGLNNATSGAGFRPGVDMQTFDPGAGMDHRLNCFNVVQLAASTTIYLRSHFNFSGAGSMTYHGYITSILLS
jgi:hypothetical protein